MAHGAWGMGQQIVIIARCASPLKTPCAMLHALCALLEVIKFIAF
jgi:hypothetical protein